MRKLKSVLNECIFHPSPICSQYKIPVQKIKKTNSASSERSFAHFSKIFIHCKCIYYSNIQKFRKYKKASNSFYWKRTIIVRSKPITADSSLLLTVPKILPNPCLFAQAMIIRMQTRITLVIYSYHRCMSFSVTYLFIRS